MPRFGGCSYDPRLEICQLMYTPRLNPPPCEYFVHAPHTMNLATGAGRGIVQNMILKHAQCVVHCGSNSSGDISGTIRSLTDLSIPRGHHILIENAAGQKNQLGADWDQFRRIYESVPEVQICVDTQHTFSQGTYDLRSCRHVLRWFHYLRDEIGVLPHLIHLNDSKVEYGKHVDRHQVLGCGFIWSASNRSLRAILKIADDENIPIISETGDAMSDLLFCDEAYSHHKWKYGRTPNIESILV